MGSLVIAAGGTAIGLDAVACFCTFFSACFVRQLGGRIGTHYRKVHRRIFHPRYLKVGKENHIETKAFVHSPSSLDLASQRRVVAKSHCFNFKCCSFCSIGVGYPMVFAEVGYPKVSAEVVGTPINFTGVVDIPMALAY